MRDAAHERVVDVRTVGLTAAVAAEDERRQRLRPHREPEELVLADRALDALAQEAQGRAVARLLVVLDEARVPAGRAGAVLERRMGEGGADLGGVLGRQDVGDRKLHETLVPVARATLSR